MMSKVISAADAAAAVKSGDRLAIPGNASILVPDVLLAALEPTIQDREPAGRDQGFSAVHIESWSGNRTRSTSPMMA